MDLHIKDIVELKKTHPCGSKQWELTRVGMDIKLRCLGCGHELMLPRSRVEKSIKNHTGRGARRRRNCEMTPKKTRIIALILVGVLIFGLAATGLSALLL